MKVIARSKKFRGAIAALAALLLCCCVLPMAAGCGQLTCDFDEMWSAAGDPGSPHVNRENYKRVEEGMTYEEVATIFEGPGYFTMEFTLAGHTTKSYDWVGVDDYNVSVSFKDGVVSRKSWWVPEQPDSEQSESGQPDSERSDSEKPYPGQSADTRTLYAPE